MQNNWTLGQYKILRVLLGMYLAIHFSYLLPYAEEVFSNAGMVAHKWDSPLIKLFPNIFMLWDGPVFVQGLLAVCATAALGFAFGIKDKYCAILMWYVLACLFGRNPLTANPSMPYAGWMLLAHLFIPASSIKPGEDMRRVQDWAMPSSVFLASWVVLGLSYSYSGYTKLLSPSWVEGKNVFYVLNNPLARDYFLRDLLLWVPPILVQLLTWFILYVELFFAPLALFRKLRPVVWSLMLFVQMGFLFLLNFPDLTCAMLLFHLFTFDPVWIRPKKFKAAPVLYFDGACGFCHAQVRLALAEDRVGQLNFAPQQGDGFKKLSADVVDAMRGDTIVLIDGDKAWYRSDAVIRIQYYLGGLWSVAGCLLWLVPKPLRDAGYDAVGRVRRKLAPTPDDLCPVLGPEWQKRFLR